MVERRFIPLAIRLAKRERVERMLSALLLDYRLGQLPDHGKDAIEGHSTGRESPTEFERLSKHGTQHPSGYTTTDHHQPGRLLPKHQSDQAHQCQTEVLWLKDRARPYRLIKRR